MSFELVTVKKWRVQEALPEGECSVRRGGNAMFHRSDLELVGIGPAVTLLADKGTLRIALRKPRKPEDGTNMVTVRDAWSHKKRAASGSSKHALINLRSAFRTLGLDLNAVPGHYAMSTKDELLIIDLGQARGA